jgi:ankyrin repeat protein
MGKPARSALTMLVEAILSGDIKAVRAQLQGTTSVSVRLPPRKNRPTRETPLMLAAERGHVPIVRFLISLGADINGTNRIPAASFIVRRSRKSRCNSELVTQVRS